METRKWFHCHTPRVPWQRPGEDDSFRSLARALVKRNMSKKVVRLTQGDEGGCKRLELDLLSNQGDDDWAGVW